MEPPTWQRLEAALVSLFKSLDYTADQYSDTGDTWIEYDRDDKINLTTLAKDLAKELER